MTKDKTDATGIGISRSLFTAFPDKPVGFSVLITDPKADSLPKGD